jgi:hypothetical protein
MCVPQVDYGQDISQHVGVTNVEDQGLPLLVGLPSFALPVIEFMSS